MHTPGMREAPPASSRDAQYLLGCNDTELARLKTLVDKLACCVPSSLATSEINVLKVSHLAHASRCNPA